MSFEGKFSKNMKKINFASICLQLKNTVLNYILIFLKGVMCESMEKDFNIKIPVEFLSCKFETNAGKNGQKEQTTSYFVHEFWFESV